MPLRLIVQFDIVIYSIFAGLLTGILFDGYRIIRGFKLPKFIIIFEDILFWFLSALIIFTFLLYTNYAFLGPYVYIFLSIALLFYFKIISPCVIRIERIITRGIGKTARVSAKNIAYPFKVFLSKMGNKNK